MPMPCARTSTLELAQCCCVAILGQAPMCQLHGAQALAENGGSVAVECGSTFCIALTASGRVVVWGSPPGLSQPSSVRRCLSLR